LIVSVIIGAIVSIVGNLVLICVTNPKLPKDWNCKRRGGEDRLKKESIIICTLAVIICVLVLNAFPVYDVGSWYDLHAKGDQVKFDRMTLQVMIYNGPNRMGTGYLIYFDRILLALIPVIIGALLVSFINKKLNHKNKITSLWGEKWQQFGKKKKFVYTEDKYDCWRGLWAETKSDSWIPPPNFFRNLSKIKTVKIIPKKGYDVWPF